MALVLQEVPGPMLTHLCMESGFVVSGCLVLVPRSNTNLWAKQVLDIAD